MGQAELLSCIDAAVLAPQPLAVDQVGAGQLGPDAGASQPLDRLPVEVLGLLSWLNSARAPRPDA